MPSHTIQAEQELAGAVQELKRELSEAHRREAATAEVLKAINRSTFDLQRVLDTLAETAARLCNAEGSGIALRYGEIFQYAALYATYRIQEYSEFLRQRTFTPGRDTTIGRVALTGDVVHIADIAADQEYALPQSSSIGKIRTNLGVPLLRDGTVMGMLTLFRQHVEPFTDRHIDLVKTFADQAVIAIENTRLFEEVQARTRALQESLEYQTAMSDVLGVISSSPDKLQPVLDAIVNTAKQLCIADRAYFNVLLEGRYHSVAATEGIPKHIIDDVRTKPEAPGRGSHAARAVLEKRPIHIKDTRLDPEFTLYDVNEPGRARTLLGVPLLRRDEVIGVITLARVDPAPFTQRQIDLVATFANQAVIAINNVDLFEEVQARTKELQESLEYQTATSEILGVISSSPTDLQRVMDSVAECAARVCAANDALIYRVDGEILRIAALYGTVGVTEDFRVHGQPLTKGTVTGRAVLERRSVHVPDLTTVLESEFPDAKPYQQQLGFRTALATPLLKDGVPLGAIIIRRMEVKPFTDKQVALLETFADQAVIAIENTRLFEAEQASKRELARSVDELASLGKVSQAVNSSLELDKVLPTILEHACAMSYAGGGTVYVLDKTTSDFRLAAAHNMSNEHIAMVRAQPMHLSSVVVGECATRREVVQVTDLSSAAPSPLLDILLRTGVRAVLAVPLLHQAEVVGVLVVRRNQPGTFSPEIIRLLEAFAAQSAIAVENARLFGEIAQKSRELEIASQHKSQFVANMSHELRTPLAAILGYAELMQEGFYGQLSEKSLDALTRIRSNGKHLLGLINTVLDIAKIESGQFTLNMAEYAIESVVETVRSATESLAQNKKLALKTEVAKSLPIGLGDEQRLTQVLLNLVGNAIKFTDAGEVRVTAKSVNGHFNVTVADTGPGIPPAEQARIFEQFHQVDSSLTKAKGGTGLGLAIAKKIVEMHGGRIWVESTVGKGSAFQMEIPTRAELQKRAL
jgi:signal transduction histidine kinase